jgi:pimeloyl-ACP methyl ester carboxylesterase
VRTSGSPGPLADAPLDRCTRPDRDRGDRGKGGKGCQVRCRAVALTLVVLTAVGVLVSGCGESATVRRLRSRLLSAADLPAGWSGSATGKVKLANTPCLSGLAKHAKRWSYQAAAFVEGESIPNLGEVLASGPGVDQVWTRFEGALASCRSATLVLGGTRVKATVRPLAFPRVGRSSSAYEWALSVAGISIGSDLVFFQAGRYRGYVSYAGLGPPQTATVEAFARAAAAKAQTSSTARVPDAVSIASAPVQSARTRLGNVAYRAIGKGPPLLLIAGFSGTMEDWDPRLVNALAQHHRVITFDNAGIGKTGRLPVPLTIDTMADQTSALLDTLGLARADVLGWSMGSMIAQALAVRHPNQVGHLILCAGYPGNGTTIRPSRAQLDAFESGDPPKVMAALFPADQTVAQNTYLAAISSYPPAPSAPADVVNAQKHAIDAWWNGADPAGPKASTIAAPTLVADGAVDQLDPTTNSHMLAKLIPGAELRLYPDAGHAFLFQDEANFAALIDSFLHPAPRR